MTTNIKPAARRVLVRTAATLGTAILASLAALGLGFGPVSGAGASVARPAAPAAAHAHSYSFSLKPSSRAIAACAPKLGGRVTIIPNSQNDVMIVSIHGAFPNRKLDLFIIQKPAKPFGVAWFQGLVPIDANGSGTLKVEGVFSDKTFSVSLGGTQTFAPTHLTHIGLWWNGPGAPFRHGCEPGAIKPILTPFNRQLRAGPQALNTAQYPDNAGPLTHVKG